MTIIIIPKSLLLGICSDLEQLWKIWLVKLVVVAAAATETCAFVLYKLIFESEWIGLLMHGITSIVVYAAGEHCELEEHDGHHVLQCAWSRIKRVLTDYDFSLMPPKEQVLPL